jgi:hypothetical protein
MRGPWASSALSLRLRLRGARARTNTSPMSSTAARVVHPAAAAPPPPRPRRLAPARCAAGSATDTATAGPTRVTTVSNRGDSLAICRVLNGMWQTSGGWGRIDRDAAVDAMLAHADAGLSTFDMADHCTSRILPLVLPVSLRPLCSAFARTPSMHVFILLSMVKSSATISSDSGCV